MMMANKGDNSAERWVKDGVRWGCARILMMARDLDDRSIQYFESKLRLTLAFVETKASLIFVMLRLVLEHHV
jgi:hypothetical protein